MATYEANFSSGGATLKLTVTRDSYSTTNNTSKLKCVLQIVKNGSGWTSYNLGGADISMTINGTKLWTSNTFDIRSYSVGTAYTLATKYITVSHNSDGTKSVSCKVNFDSNVMLGEASINRTYTCTTIPRASTITSVSNVTLGQARNIQWVPKSSSFKYKLTFSLGNWKYTTDYYTPGSTNTYTYNATLSGNTTYNGTTLYKELSEATSGSMKVTLTTYTSGGTKIGDSDTEYFTIYVPSSIKPSGGSLTLDPTNITINGTSYNYLVKGKNKLTLTTSGWSAGTGSSLESYTFSGSGISSAITTTSTSTSIASVPYYGTLTYKVKATDARGRTNTVEKTITSYDYFNPQFSKDLTATRDSENAKKIICKYQIKYATINNKNKVNIVVSYTNKSDNSKGSYTSTVTSASDGIINGEVTLTVGSATASYAVYVTVTDSLSGKKTSRTVTVLGDSRIFNVGPKGTSIAFGKISEYANTLECGWNAKFYGTASGPSGFSTSSDARVKKNIKDLDINIVDALRPVEYQLRNSTDNKIHYGFVAQEIAAILSGAGLDSENIGVIGNVGDEENVEYTLTYTEFIPLLTKYCQDLKKELIEVKSELQEIKSNINN